MPAYKVELEEYQNSYEREPEEYGSWSSSSSWHFHRISKVKDIEEYHSDLNSELDITPGQEVIVVWLEYSHGDSFGHAYKGGSASVAIFEADAYEAAKDFAKHIESGKYERDESDTKYIYQWVYEALDGQKIHFYDSWSDYFGGLEVVHIEHTRVM